MRPCTSSAAASLASRRTARSACASSVRERDPLDTLVEHDLAVERPVHRALGGDDAQALDLLVAERVGQAHDDPKARGAAALGGRVLAGDLDASDVPVLARRVHLHRDGRTGGQARGQQLLWTWAGVGAARLRGLVDAQIVAADPHDMAVSVLTTRGGLHPVQPPALRYSSGLKSNPVGTLGKKYVDFGGMFTPAAATSRTCATGVERSRNAASYSPESTSCRASSSVRL